MKPYGWIEPVLYLIIPAIVIVFVYSVTTAPAGSHRLRDSGQAGNGSGEQGGRKHENSKRD